MVTRRCFGVDTFCVHGSNCLMAPPTDVLGLAGCVAALLEDPAGVSARTGGGERRGGEWRARGPGELRMAHEG